jgi:hypothetical protein
MSACAGRLCGWAFSKDTLESTMRELAPVEYAFVDDQHERDATIHYFEQLVTHAGENGVLVFNDITWSQGMRDVGDDP